MNVLFRPLLAVVTIAAAFCITFVWPKHNGVDFDIDTSPRAKAAKKRVPYDLSQVRVLKAVITKVNHKYVEPERIVHRDMLLAGLNAIQRSVAPVLVHYEQGKSAFRIQVNDEVREFKIDDVNSPWSLTWRFQEIFSFLQEQLELDEDVKLRDVEYATVNGMLGTLDPHTILLPPDAYSEMQLSTRGEFGGLGIVISIRDGQLTVIRPMEGTPASRAGLKAKDRIVKINDESTLNMPLEEAVSRLRGTPGSSVTAWIVRDGKKGWAKERRFDLVRAVIHIESVESKMLPDAIGYVKIKNFQSNTCDDTTAALAALHRKQMRGLVLDLRDNPGGLLQQAVCLGDLFLSSGTIVTTSSNDPESRERKLAANQGTEPNYPMIILQNGGSASASEIVAGALKNHDRALVVGDKTFGKGSVQVLYSDDNDGWALKLTIAQYLTPGDVSIQGIGIPPDVQIEPMTVDREDMDLTVDKGYLRESDLSQHLTHVGTHEAQKPSVVLRYYLSAETRQRLREARPEDLEENEQEAQFLIEFARELLAKAPRPGRREILRDAEEVMEAAASRELAAAVAQLSKLGVDWSEGSDEGPSTVKVELSTNRADNVGVAGESFEVRAEVTNTGDKTLYQLRALTKSDNRLFSDRELVFGKLAPGETRQWSTTLGVCKSEDDQTRCLLPKNLSDRADGIKVEFSEAHGHAPPASEIRTRVKGLPVPVFAYTLQVADDGRGNGDGSVQKGELATIYMRVRNVGDGVSEKTVANLRNLSGSGILLRAGRFELGEMKPGDEKMVEFTFETLPTFAQKEATMEVSVADTVLQEAAGEKLKIPVASKPKRAPTSASGQITAKSGAPVLERPDGAATTIASISGGAMALPAVGKHGGFTRVDLGEGRPGWIADGELSAGGAGGPGKITETLAHMPPELEVDHGGTLVTRKGTLHIKGTARDDSQVRDLYVFVGARKVFYKSNRKAKDPRTATFDTNVPLRPGVNYVTVVARESNDVMSRRTITVRRDGADGSLLETPKNDDEPYFHAGGE